MWVRVVCCQKWTWRLHSSRPVFWTNHRALSRWNVTTMLQVNFKAKQFCVLLIVGELRMANCEDWRFALLLRTVFSEMAIWTIASPSPLIARSWNSAPGGKCARQVPMQLQFARSHIFTHLFPRFFVSRGDGRKKCGVKNSVKRRTQIDEPSSNQTPGHMLCKAPAPHPHSHPQMLDFYIFQIMFSSHTDEYLRGQGYYRAC